MSAHKDAQRALKGPDSFQEAMMAVVDWMLKNYKLLIGALVPVFLLVSGGYAWQVWQNHQSTGRREALAVIDVQAATQEEVADKARTELQKKVEVLQKKVTPEEAAEKAETAEKAGAKDAKDVAAATPKPAPVSDAEKAAARQEIEALQKQQRGIKADYASVIPLYVKFFDTHQNTPEGWRSGLTAAEMMIDKKGFAEAEPILQRIVTQAETLPFYQVQVRSLLISVLEEQGKYAEALPQADALLTVNKDDPQALFVKGRLQWLKQDKEGAGQTWGILIAKHGQTAEAQKAKTIQALWK